MKNYIAKADRKTSSSENVYHLFVGRWQPLHAGHRWLFDNVLNEGKNVLIGIRDVAPDENNPYTPEQVREMINEAYNDYVVSQRLKVIIIPDIEAICYGRGVGYDIIEFVPPKEIHDISATQIRKQMQNESTNKI
jgi:cytidyltransferase-like protein